MKSFQIRSYFWSVFPCIRTEYGDLLRKFGYFSRSETISQSNNSSFQYTGLKNRIFQNSSHGLNKKWKQWSSFSFSKQLMHPMVTTTKSKVSDKKSEVCDKKILNFLKKISLGVLN